MYWTRTIHNANKNPGFLKLSYVLYIYIVTYILQNEQNFKPQVVSLISLTLYIYRLSKMLILNKVSELTNQSISWVSHHRVRIETHSYDIRKGGNSQTSSSFSKTLNKPFHTLIHILSFFLSFSLFPSLSQKKIFLQKKPPL